MNSTFTMKPTARLGRPALALAAALALVAAIAPAPASATANARVTISQVLPNPASGPERVELTNEGLLYRAFMPVLMHHSDAPTYSVGEPPMPVLPNDPAAEVGQAPAPQTAPQPAPVAEVGEPPAPAGAVDMRGWLLGSDASGWYQFPANLPLVAKGTRVVVIFDGTGPASDDYDATDGLIELHTPAGLVDVFDNANGEVALHAGAARNADTLRSALAWAVAT
jgi:hypothetical protein